MPRPTERKDGMTAPPPVVAIDGPAASGKGTVAQAVAAALRLHYLDSGSLYRLVALGAARRAIRAEAEAGLASLAQSLEVAFDGKRILRASGRSGVRPGWWPTDGTWARSCSRTRSSKSTLWPAPRSGRTAVISS